MFGTAGVPAGSYDRDSRHTQLSSADYTNPIQRCIKRRAPPAIAAFRYFCGRKSRQGRQRYESLKHCGLAAGFVYSEVFVG